VEHWVQIDAVFQRNQWLDTCDLYEKGGLGLLVDTIYTATPANNSVSLIEPPLTHESPYDPATTEIVTFNDNWTEEKKYRLGTLKIFVNGKLFMVAENFEEIIPRLLDVQKEKQIGVGYNISIGGGTQGLHDNLTFSGGCPESISGITYQQDPECLTTHDLDNTIYSGLTTHIKLEEYFGGSMIGDISAFRMYVEPLNASQVKHNFRILKNRYTLLNPECPDCVIIVPANDLTYELIPDNDLNYELIPDNDLTYELIAATPTPTPTPTLTPTPTVTTTNTVTPTNTETPTSTPTNTPTNTETPTNTPSETPTNTPTQTPTNTETPTNTPSVTPTNTPSATIGVTPTTTETPTPTTTETPTQTPTETPTNTPSETPTQTPTVTPSVDILINPIITNDDEYISVGDNEYLMFVDSIPQPTPTPTNTSTPTITQTPTVTPTTTTTLTATPTQTPTLTATPTNTRTQTPTPTTTRTPTPTRPNTLVVHFDISNSSSYPGTGTLITDISGANNNGTLSGDYSYSSSNSGTIVMGGTNSLVNITQNASINIANTTTPVSVVIWARVPTGYANNDGLWNKQAQTGGFDGYRLSVGGTNGLIFGFNGNSQNFNTASGNNVFTANTWAMFTTVIQAGTSVVYVNGNSTPVISQATNDTFSGQPNLQIGQSIQGDGSYLPMTWGQFRYYRGRALSTSEILTLFNTDRTKYGI
jgi:hypothetical protein